MNALENLFLTLYFIGTVLTVPLSIYVSGSVITSAVKAVSGACGDTYPVEFVFNGDWFCVEVEEGAIP